MKKSLMYGSVLLLALFISASISITAQGASYKVGVTPGDWAEYSLILNSGSSSKVRVDIIAVSGTIITLNETDYNWNGSVVFKIQIDRNFSQPFDVGFPEDDLIPANLTAGDALSPGSHFLINETVPITINGSQRFCNHVALNWSQHSSNVSETNLLDFYWDQISGVLVKYTFSSTGNVLNSSETTILVSTNLFEFTLSNGTLSTFDLAIAGVAVGAIIVVLCVVSYRSKRQNK